MNRKKKLDYQYFLDTYPELYWENETDRSPVIEFSICIGWYNLLDELSRGLQPLVVQHNKINPNKFKVIQIKEKFAGLRYYISTVDSSVSKEVYSLIDEAQIKSTRICEYCGRKGSFRGNIGWMHTLCFRHYIESRIRYIIRQHKKSRRYRFK